MREHRTSSSDQYFFVKVAANFVVLLAVAGLSCSSPPTPRHAVGIEGGGQRMIPYEYAKMWDQTFTEEQWLELLRQRVHQPIAVWGGIGAGAVGDGAVGLEFAGLVFLDSRSLVLENHLRDHDLMAQHPLMFLHLFGDSDPETVLTGVAAYRFARPARLMTTQLDEGTQGLIAEVFRQRLLSHPDVRVRWAAIQMLRENGWWTPQDIQRGLSDETSDVRVTTAFWLSAAMGSMNLPGYEGAILHLNPQQAPTWRMLLVPILLDHVNDPHFYVRYSVGRTLRSLFEHQLNESQGTGPVQNVSVAVPERFDWVGSDWRTRCATEKVWRQWWAEHATAATP